MKVLLINSDLAKNRGDRAIAEGIVRLIRERFPDADIVGLSERAERDRKWFGIEFLDQDSQSLNPIELIKLLRVARQADLVLWGGGEILKDYTNKLALWYWVCKITAIWLVNRRLYGVYQGIGPTQSRLNRWLIAFVARKCRAFIARDHESVEKLIAWGVPPSRVIASSDPAILPESSNLAPTTLRALEASSRIDAAFLKRAVCIAPRSWFHYKTGGLVPFHYTHAMLRIFGKSPASENPQYRRYRQQLLEGIDALLSAENLTVVLVPMHMGEDVELCRYLAKRVVQPARVRVLESDEYSPSELRSILAQAKIMIGFRLHSTIIATSSAVPSLNYYYVDKGRVYFEQIGQSQNATPIERVLEERFPPDLAVKVSNLLDHSEETRDQIRARVDALRHTVRCAFELALAS